MIEYAVRSHSTGGEDRLQRELNFMAGKEWRLVSTSAAAVGITIHVFLFFERDTTAEAEDAPGVEPAYRY